MKEIGDNIFKLEVSDIKPIFKFRDKDSHKGMFGKVGIMGGSIEYLGAVKLASMSNAAIRSGCGVLRAIVSEKLAFLLSPEILEATIFPVNSNGNMHMIFDDKIKDSIKDLNSLAVGMGWNKDKEYEKILNYIILNYDKSLLIDADGLNTLALMNKDILLNSKCKVVLTPHLKEFERLTGISIEKIKEDREKITMDFARKYHVILLLKGEITIVTDGDKCYIVESGCPGMATAGSGDVLSGVISGILGYNEANAFNVAAAAMLTGIAGQIAQEKYTDICMKASDTIECLPEAIKIIRGEKK